MGGVLQMLADKNEQCWHMAPQRRAVSLAASGERRNDLLDQGVLDEEVRAPADPARAGHERAIAEIAHCGIAPHEDTHLRRILA
jgi:hypothetical protein